MPVPQRPIILDASCLLNLYASRKLREIAATSPQPFVVAEDVVQQEALYIQRRAFEQGPEEREPSISDTQIEPNAIFTMILPHYSRSIDGNIFVSGEIVNCYVERKTPNTVWEWN
jgi:hypothetical protein